MAESKRPKRVKTEPRARHVDGHTLKAMGGLPGEGCPVRRTAEIEDYGPAHPLAIHFNMEAIANGENSGKLKAGGGWLDNQGVAFLQLEGELDSKQVVLELDKRFKDGKLSFAAKDQMRRWLYAMRSAHGLAWAWHEGASKARRTGPAQQVDGGRARRGRRRRVIQLLQYCRNGKPLFSPLHLTYIMHAL